MPVGKRLFWHTRYVPCHARSCDASKPSNRVGIAITHPIFLTNLIHPTPLARDMFASQAEKSDGELRADAAECASTEILQLENRKDVSD